MTLSWYGLSSFKITPSGSEITIITDPFSKESGLTPPRGAANIVLISRDEPLYANTDGITGNPLIIKNPGEFDVKGVYIRGIKAAGGHTPITIYHLEVDGIRIALLGAFDARELSEEQIEDLGEVDVLVVPVGNKNKVSNWEWAVHIVQQIEPKVVVPSHYAQKGLAFELDSVDKFIKELGGETKEEDRLTLKARDLDFEGIKVVKLNPQR